MMNQMRAFINSSDKNKANRLLYIDYLKALGISLVILYHCKFVPFDNMGIHGLYAICVPLFFVINGYLMLRREYTIETLFKKNCKLLLVMFFWAFVSTLVYAYVSYDINLTFEYIITRTLISNKPECIHLWFMKTIFILNILNPIIYHFINKNVNGSIYLLVIMSLWSIDFFDIISCRLANPFVHWATAFSVLYYVAGHYFLDNNNNMIKRVVDCKYGGGFLCFIILLCIFLQWGYNWLFVDGIFQTLNLEKGWIIDIVFDNYNALFIVIITIALCMLFQRTNWNENKFWKFVGQNSLAIYLLQTPVQRLIQYWLPLDSLSEIHNLLGVILPILTLLICMLITRLMLTNKYTTYLITI